MARGVVLALLAISAASLALAPAVVPDSYSWIPHTTSESGAQGVEGAWLARIGFLMFGLAVIWLAQLARATWGPWAAALHTGFGVFITATAAFSAGSWEEGARVDRTEDLLHSTRLRAFPSRGRRLRAFAHGRDRSPLSRMIKSAERARSPGR